MKPTSIRRSAGSSSLARELERVRREVAAAVERDLEQGVAAGRDLPYRGDRAEVDDPRAAGDRDARQVRRQAVRAGRQRLEEEHPQHRVVGRVDLDVVDAVEHGMGEHVRAALLVAAVEHDAHGAPSGVRTSTTRSSVCAEQVGDGHHQPLVLGSHLDGLDLDLVGQPLLERALDQHLRRGREHLAAGREDQRLQPAAEVGPVDALAGVGEQHLADQVADVLGRRRWSPCGRGRRSAAGSRGRGDSVTGSRGRGRRSRRRDG